MKIHVCLNFRTTASNGLTPYTTKHNISVTDTIDTKLNQTSDKDIIKNYPVGDKVIYNFEKKWKTQEFIPHHSIPADLYKHITLLHPIIELLEDHDFQYVDDSILESMVVKLKDNPSLSRRYAYKDFLGIKPEEYPLRYSIPPNFEEYVYSVVYKDGIYTIVMNRMFNNPPNPYHRKDIEHGVFAQLESFVDKLNESCRKLYNSELNQHQSVVKPPFLEIKSDLTTSYNYVMLSIGFKDVSQATGFKNLEDQLKQSLAYVNTYHYFYKYFSPYIDGILKDTPLEVSNNLDYVNSNQPYAMPYGYSVCAAFSVDTYLMKEDENPNNILAVKFFSLISKSAKHIYNDNGSNAKSSVFKDRVLADPVLVNALNHFYDLAMDAYHDQKKVFNSVFDSLEKAVTQFNRKVGNTCKIATGTYTNTNFAKYRQQKELEYFQFFKFLESNKEYALNPEGLLFDIAGVQLDSDGFMGMCVQFRSIHRTVNLKNLYLTDVSKEDAIEGLLRDSLSYFETIDLGKRYDGGIYKDFEFLVLVKN